MISYEVSIGFIVVTVVICAGSFNLSEIVLAQTRVWYIFPLFPMFLMFFVSALAETNRHPFDLPEAEHELTAGFHTEYGGMKFAMFMLGEYLGLMLISCMIVTLFFGGWHGPMLIGDWMPPFFWFSSKVFVVICFFVLLRAAIPRPRYDQLMSLGWKVMLPITLVNILVTGAVLLWMEGVA
jgi:NADH-quinone oxidoreductase subunit H